MNRKIIFAHFDMAGCVRPHIIYYLQALAKLGKVIFVSTAELPAVEQVKLVPFVADVICRPNIGYDFMSWKTGMLVSGDLACVDELVICNDSCYAPIFSLKDMFDVMDDETIDFWGVTANRQIEYHVQSYFMVFKRSVLMRSEFWDFWQGIECERKKEDVIQKYEVGLSRLLYGLEMRSNVYFSIDTLLPELLTNLKFSNVLALVFQKMANGSHTSINTLQACYANPTLSLWRMLVQSKTPILKVNLVRSASDNIRMQIFDTLRRESPYPVTLIEQDLAQYTSRYATRG